MAEQKDSYGWGEYTKLVLKELERLNETYEKLSIDIAQRFERMNEAMTNFKNTETTVKEHKEWMDEVTEIWSPTQMKEAKDELYKQKNRWTATMAIVIFIQIILGLVFAYMQSKSGGSN